MSCVGQPLGTSSTVGPYAFREAGCTSLEACQQCLEAVGQHRGHNVSFHHKAPGGLVIVEGKRTRWFLRLSISEEEG